MAFTMNIPALAQSHYVDMASVPHVHSWVRVLVSKNNLTKGSYARVSGVQNRTAGGTTVAEYTLQPGPHPTKSGLDPGL